MFSGIFSFFNASFPSKMSKFCVVFLLGALLVYVCAIVPHRKDPNTGVVTIFYTAGVNAFNKIDPYTNPAPGMSRFLYGASFLIFPLRLMILLPLEVAAILWQLLGNLFYIFTAFALASHLKTKLKNKNLYHSLFIAFITIIIAFVDTPGNGVYYQSNTILAGCVILGLVFYDRQKYIWAAAFLGFATNMKVTPIVIVLLLCLEGKKKFIFSITAAYFCYFLLFPVLIFGFNFTKTLYYGWWHSLAQDIELDFTTAEHVHHFVGLKHFLQLHWKIDWHYEYLMMAVGIGGLVALGVLWRYFKDKQFPLYHAYGIGLLFILLFNTRTEGPTLMLIDSVYLILIFLIWYHPTHSKKLKKILVGCLLFMVFWISLSYSDLTKGSWISKLAYEENFRTVGMGFLFLFLLLSLFNKKVFSLTSTRPVNEI